MDVRIENVSKDFGQVSALRDASLHIETGELIALLGPSGSGKTTLLRLIAGLESPNLGAIYFGDDDAAQMRVQERNIGFVFQHYALFKHMTVLDNVSFGLKVRPRGKRPNGAEIRRRASELLELVQLSGYEKRYPMQLSGGQRQRVALARAMAIRPRVLLLDEPFGALDAQVRKDLRRWLREIHDKTGHTTVFVTHDQDEALELADRVVVMSQGCIEQIGTPDQIYDTPNSPFVFRFIGDSSELPVQIDGAVVTFRGRSLQIEANGVPSGAASLFFRPHDISLVERGGVKGVVVGSRRLAGVRRVELKVDSAPSRIEIEVPLNFAAETNSDLQFLPRRWALFPGGDTPGRIYGSTQEEAAAPGRLAGRPDRHGASIKRATRPTG